MQFKPLSSDDEDDNDHIPTNRVASMYESFPEGSPTPSAGGHRAWGSLFTSTFAQGGHIFVSTELSSAPSSSLSVPPPDENIPLLLHYNDELELGMETDDEDDGRWPTSEGDQSKIDPKELETLEGVLAHSQKSTPQPKSGNKWGSSQLDSRRHQCHTSVPL